MVGKPRSIKSFEIEQFGINAKLAAQAGLNSNPIHGQQIVSLPPENTAQKSLSVDGGTMHGPIGQTAAKITIDDDGAIDIGPTSGKYAGLFIVSAGGGEDATEDTLSYIDDPGLPYQQIYLQAKTGHTITIDDQGNILPPGGEFILNPGQIIELKHDSVANKWRFISAGGDGAANSRVDFTVPLLYGVRDYDEIGGTGGRTNLSLDLGDNENPHIHKFVAVGNIDIRFRNIPADDKALFFVVEVVQDTVGGHEITSSASLTDFDVLTSSGSITILTGMVIDGSIYLTNYGSRISTTVVQPGGGNTGGNDSSAWFNHPAQNTVNMAGNELSRTGTISFIPFTEVTSQIIPRTTHLEYIAGAGRSHQFKSDDGTILAEIAGGNINAHAKKINNVLNPTENQDAATLGWTDGRLTSKANLVHTHVIADITDFDEFSIEDLTEYTFSTGNDPASFEVPPGMDLLQLGKVGWNTTLESFIATYDTTRRLMISDIANPTNYKTVTDQVMNFHIQGVKTMALAKVVNENDPTDIIDSLEVFGVEQPLIKTVDTKYYGIYDDRPFVNIGSIYFDAYAEILNGDTLTIPIQTTFAEIKAVAIRDTPDYAPYSATRKYFYHDKVTHNNRNYRYTNVEPTTGNRPPNSGGDNYWQEYDVESLDRGRLEFVLRDINRNQFGSNNNDVFNDILTLDIDTGVHIAGDLTTRLNSVLNLFGHVQLSHQGGILQANTNLNMNGGLPPNTPEQEYTNRIINLAAPINGRDAATKAYVDANGGGGGGGGGSNINLLAVNSNIRPAQSLSFNLGSSGQQWLDVHLLNLFAGGNITHTGPRIGFRNATPQPGQSWLVPGPSSINPQGVAPLVAVPDFNTSGDAGENIFLLLRAFRSLILNLQAQGILI